jgi:hypothetical protein
VLRQWFKGATAIVLSLDGIALRTGTDDIRIISSSDEPYSRDGLLTTLEAQASELGLRRVRFILSNQLVRYAVLPWQPGIYAMRDWQALAAHQFHNQFGVMADGWDIRVALQGYGMPAVACALDRDLIERLSEISAKAGWTVQGIEPALMAVFNRHRSHFTAKSDHWLLLAEPQRLLLGQISNGAWQHFYVDSPLAGEEPMAAQRMVEHTLRLQGGLSPSAVACFGPAALLPKSLTDDSSLGITMLRLPHPVRGESKTNPNLLSLDMLAGVL